MKNLINELKEAFPSITDSNILGHSDIARTEKMIRGRILYGKKSNRMSTISIIIIALTIEYFFDDLKEYRKNDFLVKGFNYFEVKFDNEKYSKYAISVAYTFFLF